MSEWKRVRLENLVSIVTGKRDVNFGSPNGKYPFFTCAREVHKCDSFSFDCDAILLAGNCDIGNIQRYKGKFEAYQRTYVLQSTAPDVASLDYIWNCIRLDWVRYNKSKMFGAAIPYIRINTIKEFPISLPPRHIQDRIAGILSDYDSAIANCRKQIALLEEAAMRLYREWFKDGKGEKKRIGDVIEFDPPTKLRKGVRRFSVPMGALQINSMVLDKDEFEITTGNSGSKFRNGDTLLARITPCLENGKTAFVFGVDEEGSCGSTEFIVMRSKRLNPYMVYLLARTEQFRKVAIASMAGADGRQRARKEVIADYEILVPSPEAIEKLGKIHKPMFSQIEALANQIRTLTEARDRLLPKLMKGEVAV